MASGAAAATTTATAAFAVFAILVLSSLGHPVTGPLCSDCGLLCAMNCTAEIDLNCRSYCENPAANTQYCEREVFKACTLAFCCYGNCGSHDCNLEAKNCNVHDTTFDCQNCKAGTLQSCTDTCNSNCNTTCVTKGC